MIRNISVFFGLVLAVVLQTSVLPFHVASPFKPDLLLVAMVYLALRSPAASGALLAWLLGLIKDVFSGLYLGLNAFSFLIIFLVISSISDLLYAESGELFVVTVSAATLACVTANLLLLVMLTSTPGITFSMTADLLPHLAAARTGLLVFAQVMNLPQDRQVLEGRQVPPAALHATNGLDLHLCVGGNILGIHRPLLQGLGELQQQLAQFHPVGPRAVVLLLELVQLVLQPQLLQFQLGDAGLTLLVQLRDLLLAISPEVQSPRG